MVMSAAIMAGASLLGSGISAASNAASSRKAFERQKALQEQAARLNHEYSVKYNDYTLKNNPLLTRKGLEKGGYNPMLAVQNGTSGSNASSFTSPGQAPQHDMSASLSNVMDYQRLINETRLAESQSDLQNQQAVTEVSKRKNLEFQNAMLDVEKHLKDKDLSTYDKRFYSELYEQMQRAENYRAMANVQGYNAESARISANAQKAVSDSDVKWAGARALSGAVGSAIGAGIGAFGGIRGASILKDVPKRLPLGKRR